ncbi:MAG: hypothetical protein IV100_13025 [Myxococcales bacterium]|nr:hypothetical protein [Myxococcales bacterium]
MSTSLSVVVAPDPLSVGVVFDAPAGGTGAVVDGLGVDFVSHVASVAVSSASLFCFFLRTKMHATTPPTSSKPPTLPTTAPMIVVVESVEHEMESGPLTALVLPVAPSRMMMRSPLTTASVASSWPSIPQLPKSVQSALLISIVAVGVDALGHAPR